MTEKRKFYGLKNDYMFHAVLQKNEEVLRNLLATLLEMDEADIVDCHLENPIELGKEIEGKECILDVKLTLNNAKIINIGITNIEGHPARRIHKQAIGFMYSVTHHNEVVCSIQ